MLQSGSAAAQRRSGAVVQASDRQTRDGRLAWFATRKTQPPAQREARAVLLQCPFGALVICVVRDSALDLHRLEPALHRLIEQLLNG